MDNFWPQNFYPSMTTNVVAENTHCFFWGGEEDALYSWSPVLQIWIQLLHYIPITTSTLVKLETGLDSIKILQRKFLLNAIFQAFGLATQNFQTIKMLKKFL